jgi:hypothetical protein
MTSATKSSSSAMRNLVVAFAVLLAAGLAIGRFSPDSSKDPPGGARSGSGITDDFARGDSKTSLTVGGKHADWTVPRGVWGVQKGSAYVVSATGRPATAVAVVDMGSAEGSVQVRLAQVSNGSGLVFRYRDPANYWAFVVAPGYATWTIERTIAGRRTVVGNTGLSPVKAGTVAAIRMEGPAIEFMLDGKVKRRVNNPLLQNATRTGLIGRGPKVGEARWDGFRAGPAVVSAVPKPP